MENKTTPIFTNYDAAIRQAVSATVAALGKNVVALAIVSRDEADPAPT